MAIRFEKNKKDNTFDVGVDTPLGSGFFRMPAGKRDLAHYASIAAAAALWLCGAKARRGHARAAAQAERLTKHSMKKRRGRGGGFGGRA